MQSSLPAGWLTFTGRVLNPLDRCKRFQIIHPPFLDFAWRKGSFILSPPSTFTSFDQLVGAAEQRDELARVGRPLLTGGLRQARRDGTLPPRDRLGTP